DHLRDERLAHRVVEGGDDAEQAGEHVDVPELDVPGEHQRAEAEREQPHGALRGHEEAAAREAVGEQPGPRGQREHGRELERGDDADGDAGAVGEVAEDGPVLRDALDPGAGARDERGAEPDPVVVVLEGGERRAHRAAIRVNRSLARAKVSLSSGVREDSCCVSHASRRRRVSLTSRTPASVRRTTTWRRSVACSPFSTRPISARALTARVMLGGRTRSCAASSPGDIAPCLWSTVRTPNWPSGRSASPRWARSRRETRVRATRSSPPRVA